MLEQLVSFLTVTGMQSTAYKCCLLPQRFLQRKWFVEGFQRWKYENIFKKSMCNEKLSDSVLTSLEHARAEDVNLSSPTELQRIEKRRC